jgi:hypothetical protein
MTEIKSYEAQASLPGGLLHHETPLGWLGSDGRCRGRQRVMGWLLNPNAFRPLARCILHLRGRGLGTWKCLSLASLFYEELMPALDSKDSVRPASDT